MKRSMLALALVGTMLSASADDGYLYWMIDTDEAEAYSYNSVRIKAMDGESEIGYLNFYYEDGGTMQQLSGGDSLAVNNSSLAAYQRDSGGGLYAGVVQSGYSYIIELWNDDAAVQQSVLSAETAEQYVTYVSGGMFTPGASGAWTAGSFTPVPEPNSAVMLLVGCAMLALRRRKNVHV